MNAIIDLQNSNWISVDNSCKQLLELLELSPVIDVLNSLDGENKIGAQKIIDYFILKNYGFLTDTPDAFPEIDFKYNNLLSLEFCVIEFDGQRHNYSLFTVFNDFNRLGCKNFQIRLKTGTDLKEVLEQLKKFKKSTITNFEIYLSHKELDQVELQGLINLQRVSSILVYGSETSSKHEHKKLKTTLLNYTELISKEPVNSFLISVSSFSEAVHKNLGLNKKIAIDFKGNVTAYVGHKKVVANIMVNSPEEIVSLFENSSDWSLSNSMIEVCCDCQFKYVCYSNAEVIEKEGKYYKSKKCNYDPYSDKWN